MKYCFRGAVLHRLAAIASVVAVCGWPVAASAVAGSITNQAGATYGAAGSGPAKLLSNVVRASQADMPPRAPTIRYYRDAAFTLEATSVRVGDPLFVEADAQACNVAAEVAETVRITIVSAVTGDSETLVATETGTNTGRFRIGSPVMLQDHAVHPAIPGNGMVETRKNDMLSASIAGCGAGIQANILVDPSGVVFDSRNNRALAGATVTLVDVAGSGNGGNAGAPARVFEADGVTPAPSTVTTQADGVYRFPLVAPGSYRLAVTAPANYAFPSQQAPEQLPINYSRAIHRFGSYGATFPVDASTGAVTLDIPLDPAGGILLVEKKASRRSADVGDFVDYRVSVKNNGSGALNGITVHDTLPRGFLYQSGSARVNGVKLGDPAGSGAQREFALGDLAGGATRTLTYRLRVAAAALQGDGINRAVAASRAPQAATSNTASAEVKVQAGVFSDQAYIVGQVYADCDANRLRDSAEPGIPGVRLYLENGSYAVTDGEGKFSFYNVAARTHILKLYSTTLPAGSRLVALANRNAGDPGSRFVDLKNGELHKADFALGSCAPEILREVETRRAKLDGDAGQPKPRLQQPAQARSEIDLTRVDNTIGFVDLGDGATLPQAQTAVRVKGPAGAALQLAVNGRAIPEQRVGRRSTLAARDLAVWDYIGVDLAPGENALAVTAVDAFGNPRGQHTIKVFAPGPLAKLTLTPAPATAPADGKSGVKITLRLADAQGLPVAARTAVTLHAGAGRWQGLDLDQKTPGRQIFVEGGQTELMLIAPANPAEARVRAESGVLATEATVSFVPELRAPVAAGIIEGRLNVRKFDGLLSGLIPARRNDGFEEELLQFSRSGAAGDIGARAALFLKGKVKGDYLLTLAYDSDKDTQERLFRDIKPDEFYPVYGDNSEQRFDAQSASRLYLRVDKNKSWLLYGDFVTPAATPTRNLGAYSRSLTGVREHFEQGPLKVDAFASQDSTRQIVEEIPADGTSGPYLLSKPGLVSNSEQVEILTRDRNQPAIILKTVPQARFSDYQVETLTGRLLFDAPVASLDANLNPVSIRVTYEIDLGGAKFWVAGVAAQVNVNAALEVGGSVVTDRNPQDTYTLQSVNASVKLAEKTRLVAEVAQSDRPSSGTGRGERIEITHAGDAWDARAYFGRTDPAFDNPSAGLDKGRGESGAKASYRIADDTRLVGEYLRSEDILNHAQRAGGLVGVERMLGEGRRLEVGMRHVRQPASVGNATTSAQADIEALRVKLSAPVPGMAQANIYGEAEQDVHDSSRRLLAAGGEYRFDNGGRAYGRHEFVSSLGSNYALDSQQRRYATVLGLDAEYMRDGRGFGEYRAGNAFDGRGAEAAIGLRNRWNLAEGLRLNTSIEHVQVLSGSEQNQSAAVTAAIAYTGSPRWKGTARLELRSGQTSDGVLSTLGLGYKLTDAWTLLGRNRYALTRNKDAAAGNKTDEWLRLGVAYRALETLGWNGLAKYEHKLEKDTGSNNVDRSVHLVSAHANYQPDRHTALSARYAAKLALDESNGLASRGTARLVNGRITRDLGGRWDIGLVTQLLISGGAAQRQTGVGAELGYLVQENLWLSAGYNLSGFYDRDLSAQSETRKGLFVRLRFKFDERGLQGLFGGHSTNSRDGT